MSSFLDDYIDVAERIKEFYKEYPNGRLVCAENPLGMRFGEQDFVVVHARAFRNPEDQLPGDGWAWEPVPGTTNFTRNSELMNAQTAAIGRAIVSIGMLASRKIASREEVEARMAEEAPKPKKAAPKPKVKKPALDEKEIDEIVAALKEWRKSNSSEDDKTELQLQLTALGVTEPNADLTDVVSQLPSAKDAAELLTWLGKTSKK